MSIPHKGGAKSGEAFGKLRDYKKRAGGKAERGTHYAVAIDPVTGEVVERGTKPADLELDFDAIIDA
jgi:hypothetical protein